MTRGKLAGMALAGLLWTGPAAAQAAQKTDPAVQELLRLEDSWPAALVKRDRATFERLLAPRFVYSEDDKTVDRATVMRDLVAPADSVIAANNRDMQVHLFGTTAVVTGWLEVRVAAGKSSALRRYRFTDVWMRGSSGWQIVAAHDYLKPAK